VGHLRAAACYIAFEKREIAEFRFCGYFGDKHVADARFPGKNKIVNACQHALFYRPAARHCLAEYGSLGAEFHDAFAGETGAVVFVGAHGSLAVDFSLVKCKYLVYDYCRVTVGEKGFDGWKVLQEGNLYSLGFFYKIKNKNN
jgi:hypothetical protein